MLTHRSQLQQMLEEEEEEGEEKWSVDADAQVKCSPEQAGLYKWNVPSGFTISQCMGHPVSIVNPRHS